MRTISQTSRVGRRGSKPLQRRNRPISRPTVLSRLMMGKCPRRTPYEKPGQQPYQPPYGGYPPPEPPKTRAPLNPETIKLFNILSYFSFLWLVGLIADGHNPKVRYHVNQGILLTIFEVVLGLVVSLLSSLFTSLFSVALGGVMVFAQLGSTLVGLVQLAQFGAVAALIIVGVMHAVQDREEPLPLIGSLFTILK